MQRQCFVGCLIICALLWATGCGAAASDDVSAETSSHSLVEECEPNEPYTTCTHISMEKLVSWQETLDAPNWRKVEKYDGPGKVEYKVTLDATKLNGGAIPTADRQGHYKSEDHFYDTISQFLGVSREVPAFVVTNVGTTVKVDEEGNVSQASTGDFIFDALTTGDGRIYIDGKDATEKFIPHGGSHGAAIEQDGGTKSSSATTTSALKLKSGPWEIEYEAFANSGNRFRAK